MPSHREPAELQNQLSLASLNTNENNNTCSRLVGDDSSALLPQPTFPIDSTSCTDGDKNCWFRCTHPSYLLDRELLINGNHAHKISGFKLASASSHFAGILKKMRDLEVEQHNRRQEQRESRRSQNARPQRKSRRTRTRSISEIDTVSLRVDYADVKGLELVMSFIHSSGCSDTAAITSKQHHDSEASPNDGFRLCVDTLESFMKAAIHFVIPHACSEAERFVDSNCTVDNCWQLYHIGKLFSPQWPVMQGLSRDFIIRNFSEASRKTQFLDLELPDLVDFLKEDTVQCFSEWDLVETVLLWIGYERVHRDKYFVDLMKCIRCTFLNREQWQKLEDNNIFLAHRKELVHILPITEDDQQNKNVCDAPENDESPVASRNDDYCATEDNAAELLQLSLYMSQSRTPQEAIFVVGGWEGNQNDPDFGPSRAIQVYNFYSDSWTRFNSDDISLEKGHAYSSCVYLKGKIYLVGGYTISSPTQTMREFDLSAKKWRLLSPMHERRNYVSACILKEKVYALGGHNGRTRLSSVEWYDPATNSWTNAPSMCQVRSDASADTLNDKIYICGGFDGHQFYATAEMYDPKSNQWTFISNMTERRSGVSVVACHNYFYAIGGNDGNNRLRTVERYDPGLNHWQTMPQMNHQRSNFCVANLGNYIYVIGGWNDESSSTIASVEYWNASINGEWHLVSSIPMPASANCCCCVKEISDLKAFLS